jgi:hypothetical protein
MSDVTVAQFAEVLKVPVDRLLVQLESAGIQVAGPQAVISDEAKLELLTHLRRARARARSGFMPSSSNRSSAGMPDSSVSSLAMACVSSTSRARLRSSLTISSSNSSMLASSDCGR